MRFKEYMTIPSSPENATKILHKTAKSLSSHASRGNTVNGSRSLVLIDRYEETKSWLKEKSPNHWKEYCKQTNRSPDHDAYDFFA